MAKNWLQNKTYKVTVTEVWPIGPIAHLSNKNQNEISFKESLTKYKISVVKYIMNKKYSKFSQDILIVNIAFNGFIVISHFEHHSS